MTRSTNGASRFCGTAQRVRAACYAGLDSAALRRDVTAIFADALEIDASTFVAIDPATGLPQNSILLGFTRAFCQEVVQKAYLQSPICDLGVRAAAYTRAARLSDLGLDLKRDPYARTLADFGMRDDLQTVLRVGRRPVGYFALARRRRARFSDYEVTLLDGLAPHLGAALSAASLRAQRAAEPAASVAMLVLDDRGRIEVANEAAATLLRTPSARDAWDGVQAVTTILHAALSAGQQERAVPVLSTILGGRRYTLRAERATAADGTPRAIVFLEPPQRPVGAAFFHGLGLSPREAQIAGAIVRGDSTSDIAAAIGVSPNTVKTHVRSIFVKLDVGSRRELARRFVHA